MAAESPDERLPRSNEGIEGPGSENDCGIKLEAHIDYHVLRRIRACRGHGVKVICGKENA
jgi:hypothetical protein